MLESIDHVNLVVNDLEGMAEFYSALLGLTPTKRATISGPWIAAVVGLTDVEADVIYLDLPAGPRGGLLRDNRPPGPGGGAPAVHPAAGRAAGGAGAVEHAGAAAPRVPRPRHRRHRRAARRAR